MGKKGKVHRCPNCGYIYCEEPTGRKKIVRIWMSENLEEVWVNFAQNYETRELAFQELLKRAGLIEEKARAYVETPSTKTG